MTFGKKLGGYLSALKRKNDKKYQKWVDTVQSSGDSVTGRVERLMLADLNHGIFDLDEKASGRKKEQKEIKKLEENVSIAGAINALVETMAVQNIQSVQTQQAQLQQMGIDPMRQELQSMQEIKAQNAGAIEQQQAQYSDILSKKKAQERLLREQEERLKDSQAEYARLTANIQAKKVQGYSSPASTTQDVPVRTEDNGKIPLKRDAKGHFLPRSEGGSAKAPLVAQSEGQK